MTLDEYVARVKTGQDLIDAGVIPKDSSTHLALIALKRLEAIRDHLLANINEEVLGMWLPAVDQKSFEVGQFVTSQDIIKKYAKEGMRIRANNQDSLEGTIKDTRRISEGWLVIEYDRNIQDGSTMNGMCASGRGAYAKIDQIGLIVPGGKITEGYTLAEGVVADEQLGHKLRFGSDFRGEIYDTNFYKLGEAEIPKHTKAKLEAFFDSRSDSLQLLLDENLKGLGNRKRIVIPGEQLYSNLQVSSLGQLEPKDKEMEVRKQTLMDFLPKTVLDSERAERIITGLLMAKDMILYGPPGGGKTNVANDIIDIAMQQEAIFIVDGCQAQCNPYSLFDESFAKVVPP